MLPGFPSKGIDFASITLLALIDTVLVAPFKLESRWTDFACGFAKCRAFAGE